MVEVRAQNPLQRWVDLHQQPPDPVARRGHLPDDVIVESAQHRQLRDLLVFEVNRAEGVRQSARSFGDDRRVTGIRLRFAGVQVGDAPHRESRQIAHENTFGIRDSHRQRADGFGLVNDQEHGAADLELLDHGPQFGLVVGERFVVKSLPGAVESDRVMFAFSNVKTYEHVNAVVILNHEFPVSHADRLACPRHQVSASTLRSAKKLVPVEPLLAITQYQSGPVTTPPGSLTTGGSNHAGPNRPTPLRSKASRATYKVTGAAIRRLEASLQKVISDREDGILNRVKISSRGGS